MQVGDLVTYDDPELIPREWRGIGVILEIMSWVDSGSYNGKNCGIHIKVMWQDTGACDLHEYGDLRLVE